MERFNNKFWIVILLIILLGASYWWINRIEDIYQRVIAVLVIAGSAYLCGRLHGQTIERCNNAKTNIPNYPS